MIGMVPQGERQRCCWDGERGKERRREGERELTQMI